MSRVATFSRLFAQLLALCASAALLFLAALLPLPALSQTTCQATITSLADSGTGSLRAALADSTITSICITAQGTIPLQSTLSITHPVSVTGPGFSLLTLSGQNSIQPVLVELSNTVSNPVTIQGLTISNGSATIGGGIRVASGFATLFQLAISGNSAQAGGGVYNQGTLTIQNTTVTGNSSTNGLGGGIVNLSGGTLTLVTDSISQNTSYANGGGISNTGTVSLEGTQVLQNTATEGGGIYNNGQLSTVSTSSVISDNTSSGNGGGLYNDTSGSATVTGMWIDSNQASNGGGFYNAGTLQASESTFSSNTSSVFGGAIYNVGALTLTNNTISTNTATNGGGGLVHDSSDPTTDPSLVLHNTIISGNSVGDCSGCTGASADNLIGGTVNLGPLGVNGGTVRTFMPLPGSPAIGGGVYQVGETRVVTDATDQRGLSRTTLIGETTSVDVGAVQTHYSSVSFATEPTSTIAGQTITPPVAVTVAEVDGSTTNYPLGVPVTVSLITADSAGPPTLNGTLTQYPTVNGGTPTAVFNDLSVNTAGSYTLQATTYPSEPGGQTNAAYNGGSSNFTISPAPINTVTLAWTPATLTYGTPVPASELNGTVTVNGVAATCTCTYTFTTSGATINVGQVYPAANYSVTLTYTPATGPTQQYTLTTNLLIQAQTPTISLLSPPYLQPGTALTTANLHGSAVDAVSGAIVPGSFTYSQALGSVPGEGTQTVTAQFTPADATDYLGGGASTTFNVLAPLATTTTLTANPNPASPNEAVTLTASVTPTVGAAGVVGGPTAFTADSAALATKTLTLDPTAANFQLGAVQTTTSYQQVTPYAADFNGDGAADMLIPTSGGLSLLLSQLSPGLSLGAPVTLNLGPNCSYTLGVGVGDVNGDGLPDIATVCDNSDSTGTSLVLLLNEGGGTFVPLTIAALTNQYNNALVAVGDFNGDGHADIVLLNQCGTAENPSECFQFFSGSPGGGAFLAPTSETLSGVSVNDSFANLVVADFNHDGAPDLAFLYYGGNSPDGIVQVWQNSGGAAPSFGSLITGGYVPTATITAGGSTGNILASLVSADLNQDGLPDLALVTNNATTSAQSTLSVALNASSGGTLSFPSATTDTTNANTDGAQGLYVADFDGDGIVDAVIYSASHNTVQVLHGAGDGTFAKTETNFVVTVNAPFPIDAGAVRPLGRSRSGKRAAARHASQPNYLYANFLYPSLAVGDVNGDGYPDLLLTQQGFDVNTETYPVSAQQLVTSGATIAQQGITAPSLSTTYTAATTPASTIWAASLGTVSLGSSLLATQTALSVAPASPTVYGQALTVTATVTNTAGTPVVNSGSVSVTVDSSPLGSATVTNGVASFAGVQLTAGSHIIGATYTPSLPTEGSSTATPQTIQINKATPVLTWATPAPIPTTTPLSSVQLDASATGITNAALPGSFVYTPIAGTTLAAGTHTLSVTFTPTDTTNYATATTSVQIQVTAAATQTVLSVTPATLTYGAPQAVTATITNLAGSAVVQGGQVVLTADNVTLATIAITNGVASLTGLQLTGGSHVLGATYSGTANELASTATPLTVNVAKATPTIVWAQPAPITSTTPLSSTQLDAAITGVTGTALAGTTVYNPLAGSTLSVGTHTLTVSFTPTDTADYTATSAQVQIQVGAESIVLSSLAPSTAPLGNAPLPIVLTGSNFPATAVVELNGTILPTKPLSANTLGTTIPAAYLEKAGSLTLNIYDAASLALSNSLTFTVVAQPADVTITAPPTVTSGDQPAIGLTLSSPYPVDLTGTLTLTFTPGSGGIDDPAIQFATGGRTTTFTVPAGTTTGPTVPLQTGTVEGTITVTLVLTAGGVNVTPSSVTPAVLVIPPAAPTITAVTFSSAAGTLTVQVSGFSNTREMTQALFTFSGPGVPDLAAPAVLVPATDLFGTWYGEAASDPFGSTFLYSQTFTLSDPNTNITGVSVTLTNTAGASASVNSQ